MPWISKKKLYELETRLADLEIAVSRLRGEVAAYPAYLDTFDSIKRPHRVAASHVLLHLLDHLGFRVRYDRGRAPTPVLEVGTTMKEPG
jgi:hypothetical protein